MRDDGTGYVSDPHCISCGTEVSDGQVPPICPPCAEARQTELDEAQALLALAEALAKMLRKIDAA